MQARKWILIASIFALTNLTGANAIASNNPVTSPDFYLGKAYQWVLALGSQFGLQAYIQVIDPVAEKRIHAAMANILSHPALPYRYQQIQVILIRGVTNEPNAASIGPVIYISHSLVSQLNDRQLTAVLAHEMAHSEKAHLLQRVPMPLGAVVFQFVQKIYSGLAHTNETHQFVAAVRESVEMVNFAMELQADCYAAKQLAYMSRQGLANEPTDLISAASSMFGYDVLKGDTNESVTVRAHAIQAHFYEQSCEY